MYYRLAFKNLASQKSRTILTAIGIAIGTASLLGIIAFSTGIKNAVIDTISQRGPLTQITVQPKTQEGTFLRSLTSIAAQKDKITTGTVEKIKKINHVKDVYPQINYDNISSLRVKIWDQTFQTDAMIFGLPFEFIEDDLAVTAAAGTRQPEQHPEKQQESTAAYDWQEPSEPYPALISRRIIDLYNLTVAPTNNLPVFSEEDIKGLEFTLMPGKSTFFPMISSNVPTVEARIVGFSDKVDLIGVTLPIEVVRKFNLQQDTGYEESYLKVFVNVDDQANVEAVTSAIENMDLKTSSTKMEIQIFENNFRIVTVGLSLISAIILLVSGLMIANTYLSSVNERKKEIGLFRALGATRGDIQKMFLAEASVLGLIGGAAGIFFAWVGGFIVDAIALSAFPDVTSKPDTLLYYDYSTMLFILAFAAVLSIIFAFIPSTKAAYLEPLKALSE